jgi:hypothetical protein
MIWRLEVKKVYYDMIDYKHRKVDARKEEKRRTADAAITVPLFTHSDIQPQLSAYAKEINLMAYAKQINHHGRCQCKYIF